MPSAVSMRKRVEVIYWHGRGLSLSCIASQVVTSVGCVRTWVNKYNAGSDLSEGRRTGRPRTYNLTHAKQARAMLLRQGFGGLAQAATALQRAGTTTTVMSKSTLLRLLKEGVGKGWRPIVADRSRPTAALTQAHKQARLQFATENIQRVWDNVMFTDRKRFYFRYPGCSVNTVQWRLVGTKVEVQKVSRAYCANVYLGMTKWGCTKLVFVAGSSKQEHKFFTKKGSPAKNITASQYEQVLTDHLLPQGQALMRANGHTRWWFQQDNDPTHRDAAGVIKKYNKAAGTRVMLLPNWPAHSPDLSLIENGWAYLQRELDKAGCKTFKSWVQKLKELVSSVPQAWLDNAYAGMASRLQETINKGGDKTKH